MPWMMASRQGSGDHRCMWGHVVSGPYVHLGLQERFDGDQVQSELPHFLTCCYDSGGFTSGSALSISGRRSRLCCFWAVPS